VPRLAALKRETADVTIETEGDEPLIVTYRKGFLSPELAERLDAAESLPPVAQLRILADLVQGAVLSWNLTDDAGEPLPVTRETVSALDSGALQVIAQAIQEAMRPDPLSEGSSSNGSSPKADSEAALTGSPS
jgi:hypothetical protein